MKGILKKTQSGWIINYDYTVNKNDWCTLSLHPADVEQINKDSQVFDNIEARIASNPEVEFEIVTEYWSGEVGVNGLTYAKLLHHSVEPNEMIDHIGDANKMVCVFEQTTDTSSATICKHCGQEKFMHQPNVNWNCPVIKQTLYTEEQVIKVTTDVIIKLVGQELTLSQLKEYIIQSLKQPKQ